MNRDAALTQQGVNMVDQVTPDGSLTYSQNGTTSFVDSTGKLVETPRYTATTTLSAQNKAIKDQTDAASLNLGQLANQQTAWLRDNMSKEVDLSGAPALQTSLFGLNKFVGKGHSNQIGGNYSDTVGNGYNSNFSGNIGGSYSDTIGDGYTTSYAGADDFSADRQRVESAIKARGADDLAASRRNLETQLVGRGLRPGTSAWNSEMDRLSRAENDFNMAAILAGGQEQSRMVGMARDAAQFGNNAITNRFQLQNGASAAQAQFAREGQLAGNASEMARFQAQNAASMDAAGFRNNAALQQSGFENEAALAEGNFNNATRAQGVQEAYAKDNHPIQKIAALLNGSQIQNPQFVSTPTASVGGVDYTGMVNDQYKSQMNAYGAKMGGLFGLLGTGVTAGMKYSDRRTKTNVTRIGTLKNGLPFYSFRYIWDADTAADQRGVMSDDVRRVMPEAVKVDPLTGFDMVDYSMIGEAA